MSVQILGGIAMQNRVKRGCFIGMRGLFALAFLIVTAHEAYASEPNLYELAGRKVQISYATTSFTGEPRLSYRSPTQSLEFRGDEIRAIRTEIGQQITVTLREIPDLKTITLTLLIPDINLERGTGLFKTKAIVTTHRTTIGGPALVQGPIQSYDTQDLFGRASEVAFIQPGEMQSFVIGEITLSPTCPGPQRPGQSCVGPFAGATVQILDAINQVVATTKSDTNGLFATDLPAGSYTIHIDVAGRLPACNDKPVSVPKEGGTPVVLHCDTGLR
jgi:hypothetical protein